jgi:hypothetical protein
MFKIFCLVFIFTTIINVTLSCSLTLFTNTLMVKHENLTQLISKPEQVQSTSRPLISLKYTCILIRVLFFCLLNFSDRLFLEVSQLEFCPHFLSPSSYPHSHSRIGFLSSLYLFYDAINISFYITRNDMIGE